MSRYDPYTPGPYAVTEREFNLDDAARNRTFSCSLWVPSRAIAEPVPVILYSHSSGTNKRAATLVFTHLASHGYGVASLNHSETFAPELVRRERESADARAARVNGWIANRVPDIRFLLDALLTGTIAGWNPDPARIGLIGHSFGGWTVLAVPDLDRRIGAVVAFAPAGGKPTPPGMLDVHLPFTRTHRMPTLFVVAEDDTSLPLSTMHELFQRTPEPKQLVVLSRTDHLHFVDDVEHAHEAVRAMLAQGPLAHLGIRMRPIDDLAGGEETQRILRGLTLAHFDAALRANVDAEVFLKDVPGRIDI